MVRWIRLLRVVSCLAEMIQQIHSLRASGVRSLHAARISSELSAIRKSVGVLCTGPTLIVLFSFKKQTSSTTPNGKVEGPATDT